MVSTEYQIDEAQNVRPGEELDAAELRSFLDERLPGGDGSLAIEQFRAGHSNLTYRIDWGAREYVLRRPPMGTRPTSGHDMTREYRILEALSEVVDWVPEPILLCEDEDVLGTPFFLMERVRGVIPRGSDGAMGPVSAEQWARLSALCVDTLVAIHGVEFGETGLGELGRPEGYIERQIHGWTRRWERSKTEEIGELDDLARWLEANRPDYDPNETALIHNDFKYDNLVLEPTELSRVRAVLDWELATVGDRRMDLGTTLAYWTEASDDPALLALGLGPTIQPGNFTRRQVLDHYESAAQVEVREPLFFYLYGLFKVAVIGQQIYYRYHHGQTSDPRFAGLIEAIKGLGRQASMSLARGSITLS